MDSTTTEEVLSVPSHDAEPQDCPAEHDSTDKPPTVPDHVNDLFKDGCAEHNGVQFDNECGGLR